MPADLLRSRRRLAIGSIGIVLLLVFYNSVWTQETKKSNPKIKELQQQRLALLEQVRDSATRLFQNARIEYEEVFGAERELLAARIAYAETKDDRIKACDEAVKNAMNFHQFLQARKQAARGTHLSELKAQCFLLEMQIMRENAETNE